jgi:hypothetical protein
MQQLGHRRRLERAVAGVLAGGGVPDQLPRRFDLGGHVGQPEADRLVLMQKASESLAFLGVADRCFQRRARHAHALRRDSDSAGLQIG